MTEQEVDEALESFAINCLNMKFFWQIGFNCGRVINLLILGALLSFGLASIFCNALLPSIAKEKDVINVKTFLLLSHLDWDCFFKICKKKGEYTFIACSKKHLYCHNYHNDIYLNFFLLNIKCNINKHYIISASVAIYKFSTCL